MTKNTRLKRVICSTLALLLMLSFTGINVFAQDTKEVTVIRPESVVSTNFSLQSLIRQYSAKTYYYDDGTYRGTLYFSEITDLEQAEIVPVPDPQGSTYYRYNFNVVYTGTVVRSASKDVTVTQSMSTVTNNMASVIAQYSSSTYNYDDGVYKGKLAFSQITDIKQGELVPVPVPSGAKYYRYTFNITYTGTVYTYSS